MAILAIPEIMAYIIGAALLLALLIIFVFALSFYRLAAGRTEPETQTVSEKESVMLPERTQTAVSLDDITDEDMLAAALVAAVDYAEETKKDVRLLSIRQIA